MQENTECRWALDNHLGYTCSFYGNITPARIGNFIRIHYLKKITGKNSGESSVNVILDKIVEFVSLFIFAVTGLFVVSGSVSYEVTVLASGLIFIFILGIFILSRKNVTKKIMNVVMRFFVPENLKKRSGRYFQE